MTNKNRKNIVIGVGVITVSVTLVAFVVAVLNLISTGSPWLLLGWSLLLMILGPPVIFKLKMFWDGENKKLTKE